MIENVVDKNGNIIGTKESFTVKLDTAMISASMREQANQSLKSVSVGTLVRQQYTKAWSWFGLSRDYETVFDFDNTWLKCDGKARYIDDYPELAELFPKEGETFLLPLVEEYYIKARQSQMI